MKNVREKIIKQMNNKQVDVEFMYHYFRDKTGSDVEFNVFNQLYQMFYKTSGGIKGIFGKMCLDNDICILEDSEGKFIKAY